MNLKQRLLSAIGWSFALKIGFQLVTWVMTLVVIRLLKPEDYGLMALSQVFANFALGFSNLGLGDALVQRRDLSHDTRAAIFGLMLALAFGLAAAVSLAAYPLAVWYGDGRLVPLIQLSSLNLIFNALTALPRAELTKALQVKPIFLMELSSGLIGGICVFALAYDGFGVWALVLGWLAGNVSRVAAFALLAADGYVCPAWQLDLVKPLFGYGIYRTLEYAAWTVLTSADVMIIGRILGPVALGIYTVAMNFAAMPLNKIAPIINSTAFPAFAEVQNAPDAARFYAIKALRLMALVAVPVFWGISALSPEIVKIVFGPHWLSAEPVLHILAIALSMRAILLVLPNYLVGVGDARAAFWVTASAAAILPPAIVIGCGNGLPGAALAWLAGYAVIFVIAAEITHGSTRLAASAILRAPLPAFCAGGAMWLGLYAIRLALPPGLSPVAMVTLLVPAGAIIYAAVLMAGFPPALREARNLLPGRKR
jgi:O-antigen/teichoic acid export membrane protein